MYDGADLPYAENVSRTRDVVAAAREARPPKPSWGSGTRATSTCRPSSPIPRKRSVRQRDRRRRAGGGHRYRPRHDRDRGCARRGTHRGPGRNVDAALVMHGSSGVDDETLARAVEAGIRKVNLSTALQRVFMDTLRQSAIAPGHETDARAVLGDAR